MQAAALGVIDFRQAKFHEPSWWRRLNLVLKELVRQNNQQLLNLHFQHSLAIMQVPGLDPKHFKDFQRRTLDTLQALVDSYQQPYTPRREQGQVAEIRTAVRQWIAEFGDPSDPKVAAAIDATAEGIKNQSVLARRQNNGSSVR